MQNLIMLAVQLHALLSLINLLPYSMGQNSFSSYFQPYNLIGVIYLKKKDFFDKSVSLACCSSVQTSVQILVTVQKGMEPK